MTDLYSDLQYKDSLERVAADREEEEYVMSEYYERNQQLENKLLEDELGQDEGWQTASRILYKFNTGDEFAGEDQDLTKYGIQEMSNFNYKFFSPDALWSEEDSKGLVGYMNDIGSRMTDREKLAFYVLMDAYDEKETTWRGTGRAVAGVATDPTTWAGLITMAGLSAKIAGRVAVKEGLKVMLNNVARSMASKYAVRIGAAEGGSYTGAYSVMRQDAEASLVNHDMQIKDFFNTNTAMSVGLGTTFGGAATWAIPATGRLAVSIGRAVEDMVTSVTQDIGRTPLTRQFDIQTQGAVQQVATKKLVQTLVDGIDDDVWKASQQRRADNDRGPGLTKAQAVDSYMTDLQTVLSRGTTEDIMHTPERIILQTQIATELMEMNGFGSLKSYKKVADDAGVYELEVGTDQTIDIVLGPPASGKSTISEPLVVNSRAVLIDADEAKSMLPEFEGGLGNNQVHAESASIVENIMLDAALAENKNIVLPMIGRNQNKVERILDLFSEKGYAINIHYVDLPLEIAAQRMLTRHSETGKLIPIEYLMSIGDSPTTTYNAVKTRSGVNGYKKVDNNVAFGQAAEIVEDTIASIGTGPVVRAARGNTDGQYAGGTGAINSEGQGQEVAQAASTEYRGLHTAPAKDEKNSGDDLSNIFPDDIYSPQGARYYGHGDSSIDVSTIRTIKRMRGDPDAAVTIYRAVPENVTEILPGDWVTINKKYADQHGLGFEEIDEPYHVISKKITASEIHTDGNSIHEWGYNP